MTKGKIVGLSIVVAIILVVVISMSSLFSLRGTAVSLEEKIKAQHVSNQSSYDNMWKSFVEMTQVTQLQADQYKEAYTGLITGRYNDSGLLFKMVKEDNPKLDASVYTRIQQAIEAGRKGFANDQTKVTDIVREYNTFIKIHFIMTGIFGFKEKDAKAYIITSARTENAFQTGQDEVIDITGGKK